MNHKKYRQRSLLKIAVLCAKKTVRFNDFKSGKRRNQKASPDNVDF